MRPLLLMILLVLVPAFVSAQEPSEPILRMKLDKQAAIPGQPIILSVTVLVPTWLPKPPVFPSFETPNVIVRLPPRASGPTSQRVGRATWSGITRAYQIYPMTVGRFRIAPQPVTVTYADPKSRKPVTATLRTDAVVFEGVAPNAAKDLEPFIAAETLTLEQTIEGEPGKLEPGDAITVTVTARIAGTSPVFLPPLISPIKADGFAAYPKEPVVTENMERGIPSGQRVERVTYVAEAGGRHAVPPVRLRWFGLREKQVKTAEVPGFELVSRGPPPSAAKPFNWQSPAPWIVGGILVVVLAGLILLRLRRRVVAVYRYGRDSYRGSEYFAFAQATAAARARNFSETLRAIDLWSMRLPPMSMAADARLNEALARLGVAYYGRGRSPSPAVWTEALSALRAARRARRAAITTANAGAILSPLNPRRLP